MNYTSLYDRMLKKFSELVLTLGYSPTEVPKNEYVPSDTDLEDTYKIYAFTRKEVS